MMKALAPLAAALLLAACSASPPQPLHYYQLSAHSPVDASASLARSVGIGPLKWPEYLNRRALLVRQDAHTLDSADNDRWAEALEANFERVLRENLARNANPQRLQAHPWPLTDAPAIQVPIEVLQFDSDRRGSTVLRARWRIVGRDKSEWLAERNSEIRIQAQDGSAAARVAAHSEALAQLGEEIARQLLALGK